MSRTSRFANTLNEFPPIVSDEKAPDPSSVTTVDFGSLGLRVSYFPTRSDGKSRASIESLEEKLKALDEEDFQSFPPTNFYVNWPANSGEDAVQGSSNNWLRPGDLLPRPWQPKSAREFPARMSAHNPAAINKASHALYRDPYRSSMTNIHNADVKNNTGAVLPGGKPLTGALRTLRPGVPKRFDEVALMSGPSPGTYNLKPLSSPAPAVFAPSKPFQALLHRDNSVNLAPGAYNPEPLTSQAHSNPQFDKSSRFDPISSSKTPGAGHYNINLASISAESGVHSFSSRPSNIPHRRSRMPDCGTYHIPEALFHTAPVHRFPAAPRFEYHEKALPAHAALVLSDARKREREIRYFKPQLQDFTRQRKEAAIESQKAIREQKQAAVEEQLRRQRISHEEKVDRIVNKDKYRELARQEREARDLFLRVQSQWLVQVALASRTQLIKENIRAVRTQTMLRQLAQEAAKTIQKVCLNWLQRARTNRKLRAARIIYRTLRRNVLRSQWKRKHAAIQVLSRTFLDSLHKAQALKRIRLYREKATKIQTCWRRFYICRDHSIKLLERQWSREEEEIMEKYQSWQGEESYEKLRKKGLLLKNIPLNEQKQKIQSEIPFSRVSEPIRREILKTLWNEKLLDYRRLLQEYHQKCIYTEKLHEFASNLQEEIQEKQEKKKRIIEGSEKLTRLEALDAQHGQGLASNAGGEGDLASLLSEMPDLPQRPQFRTLIPVVKMFSLIALGHQRQGLPKDERAQYKRVMNQLIRQYAARVKTPKGRAAARFSIALTSPTTANNLADLNSSRSLGIFDFKSPPLSTKAATAQQKS